MRFEYCCSSMMLMIGEFFRVNEEDNTLDWEGYTINYCPFCGEKIEIVINNGEDQVE